MGIQPPVTGNPVVNSLLGRMSLAEKFRLLEWATAPGQRQSAALPGLRRLGIPALHLTAGPLGTARRPPAAMTAPLGVAATFSRADAYANGVVLGRDARGLGQQAVPGPSARSAPVRPQINWAPAPGRIRCWRAVRRRPRSPVSRPRGSWR
jgi:beta-glucosidase-like glycosyl hydrolase